MRLFHSEHDPKPRRILYATLFAFFTSLILGCVTPPQATDGPPVSPAPKVLRVGISGDYAPFAVWNWPPPPRKHGSASSPLPQIPMGFSVEVARAYADDRGAAVEWVPFRWPNLTADLLAERFHVALSGVTVRPDRTRVGRFSIPLTTSGAVALLPEQSQEARRIAAGESPLKVLDAPGIRIAVNAGGHLEAVTRSLFRSAKIRPVAANAEVLGQLDARSGLAAQAVITDLPEAPHWQAKRPGLMATDPLTQDRKAAWFSPANEALVADFDAWLMDFEVRGKLAALRARFGLPDAATARPTAALIAALEDRLALMVDVAESKRILGKPVEDRGREKQVLDAAVANFQRETQKQQLGDSDVEKIRRLFRAQIEAAKSIQRAHLARSAAIRRRAPTPSEKAAAQTRLDAEIRPALIFLGDRITRLLVTCQASDAAPPARAEIARALSRHAIPKAQIEEIGDALNVLLKRGEAPRAQSIRPESAEAGKPHSG